MRRSAGTGAREAQPVGSTLPRVAMGKNDLFSLKPLVGGPGVTQVAIVRCQRAGSTQALATDCLCPWALVTCSEDNK